MVSFASAQLFPANTMSSLTSFLQEQLNPDGKWEVAISEKSYPSGYQNVREGKLLSHDKKLSKPSEFYYLEPGLHPSITDIVEVINTLIHEGHNHSKTCITVKVSRRTHKVDIYIAIEGSDLALFSTYLGHIFGSFVGNEFGVMLGGKGPHKQGCIHNIGTFTIFSH